MLPKARLRERRLLLPVAAAALVAALSSVTGTPWAQASRLLFSPPAGCAQLGAQKTTRSVLGSAGDEALGEPASRATEGPQLPQARRPLLGSLLGVALGVAAALAGKAGAVRAYDQIDRRTDVYNDRAKQLNQAVDWYLFEIRPLVFPPEELAAQSNCEELGDQCVELAGLTEVSRLYETVGATRGGGGVTLSKLDRDVFTPMKLLATSAIFDPDTEDELVTDTVKMERIQALLQRAARAGRLAETRKRFNEGAQIFNDYFQKVNTQTSLPYTSANYLMPIPNNPTVLQNEKYWVRRGEKYLVKKKVDAVSKANKTARFYAKSIFGDDAESWDPRGDRATDYAQ